MLFKLMPGLRTDCRVAVVGSAFRHIPWGEILRPGRRQVPAAARFAGSFVVLVLEFRRCRRRRSAEPFVVPDESWETTVPVEVDPKSQTTLTKGCLSALALPNRKELLHTHTRAKELLYDVTVSLQ